MNFGDSKEPEAPTAKSDAKSMSDSVTPVPLTVSGCTSRSDPQMSADKLEKLQQELAVAKAEQKKKKKEDAQEKKKANTQEAQTEKNGPSNRKKMTAKSSSSKAKAAPKRNKGEAEEVEAL